MVKPEKFEDDRGYFARIWDSQKFLETGLSDKLIHCNTSFSKKKGTMHGLHFQLPPYQEDKIIRCIKGSIFDVIIDLRDESTSYKKWYGITLSEDDLSLFYVPKGCAHGFVTLSDNSEVIYFNSQAFNEKFERGIRWDDKTFNIKWPIKPIFVSKKDSAWKPFEE